MPPPWTEQKVIDALLTWAAAHNGEPPSARDWSRATPAHPTARTVTMLYGGWNAGLLSAGLPPRRRRRRTVAISERALDREIAAVERDLEQATLRLEALRRAKAALTDEAP